MRLIDLVHSSPRRLVVPLMGNPGAKLTNSTIVQNEFNSELQHRSIMALVERFEPDAVFFMMDLAVEAGSIGLPVKFPLHEAPTVEDHPVKCIEDLEQFKVLDPLYDARVRTYLDTMNRLSKSMDILKGAYIIGPFTFAGLMIGATQIAMSTVLNPALVHAAAEFATEISIRYGKALIESGADMVAILEPTAALISEQTFVEFSQPYLKRLVQELDTMTIMHICGNTKHLIHAMCDTGAQGLNLDAPRDRTEAATMVPKDVVLMGNIDPVRVMVNETPQGVTHAVDTLLNAMAPYPNFILSTGCDLPAETPLENIAALINAGKSELSRIKTPTSSPDLIIP